MFERFTRAARQTVINAVAIAGERGDPRIGTEHLLAGVAGTASAAADLLDRMGAGSDRIRTAIDDLDTSALAAVGIDRDFIRLGPAGTEWLLRKRHIPFNRAAKRVLEEALREALARNHRHIGSEHILAALTSTSTADPARRILDGLGIDVSVIRRDLRAET